MSKVLVLEHRSSDKDMPFESIIVGIFSSKEKAEEWLKEEAADFDKMEEGHFYWFAAWYEEVDNADNLFMDLFYYDHNGIQIENQPLFSFYD